jgi:3alpha(or 20beta)-hydroxysteroid dehydrogenase
MYCRVIKMLGARSEDKRRSGRRSHRTMTDLAGTTAIITGGAQGQGAAEVRRFVTAGARVAIADVQADAGGALADELGHSARFVELDVTSGDNWEAALHAIDDWAPVTVLVNNAGIHWNRSVETETAEGMARMLEVNVIGAMLGVRAVVPAMRQAGGGSIVNICSVLGMVGGRDSSAYSASKWALRGFTKSAAMELGRYGIRVNAVHPGYIETPMLANVSAGRPQEYFDYLPMQRTGSVDDVADLVLFLASSASGYLTGGDFVVDGGMLAGAGPRSNFPGLA